MTGFAGFVALSFLLVPYLGRNFFPSVDAGQILMHVRTQVGTRVEDAAGQFADIQKAIRTIIPPEEIDTLADNIGMPISGINMTYNNTGVIGPQDGDVQIKLREGHRPTEGHVKALREQLPRLFPGLNFAFLPAVSSTRSSISARRRRSMWRYAAPTSPATSLTPTGC